MLPGFLLVFILLQPSPKAADSMWEEFAAVLFKPRYHEGYKEYFLYPEFTQRIRSFENKEIFLTGHYLPYKPVNKSAIIISRYPFASCFFCGGAGPESVAEVIFQAPLPRFRADQVITVKGMLKLNDTDVDHLNFIILNATLVTDKSN